MFQEAADQEEKTGSQKANYSCVVVVACRVTSPVLASYVICVTLHLCC